MKSKIIILLLLGGLGASCVKDTPPECPYQYNVQVYVKDKNYSNVVESDKISEDLPFRQYVNNIYYTLQNVSTGENIIEPQYLQVKDDNKEIYITFNTIPDGEYVLTIWGNVNEIEAKSKNLDPGLLHPRKTEEADLYVASTNLKIVTGIAQEASAGLERTKGRLNVKVNNLPASVSRIEQSISEIQLEVNNRMRYTNITDVLKTFLSTSQALDSLVTFLAPTVDNDKSDLTLSLYDASNKLFLTTPPVKLEIERNEISSLTITYNQAENNWEIWQLVDNEWVLINRLQIE